LDPAGCSSTQPNPTQLNPTQLKRYPTSFIFNYFNVRLLPINQSNGLPCYT
jgi:hypothetical protein